MTEIQIEEAHWQDDRQRQELMRIRQQVFMQEQQVSADLEWDGLDANARHFLAYDDNGEAIACARLLVDGHVGRMAVLAPWRGQGVGSKLLQHVIQYAQDQGYPELFLDAQTHALQFYSRHGFIAKGDEFLDAGIPHRSMRLAD